MSYLKMSPLYGQDKDNFPLSSFCETLDEAKCVIDRQEEYIRNLDKDVDYMFETHNKTMALIRKWKELAKKQKEEIDFLNIMVQDLNADLKECL